jgi:hypothetical protein
MEPNVAVPNKPRSRLNLEEGTEALKMKRLQRLVEGALQQGRKKLRIIELSFAEISIPNQITSETKSLCSIVIEINEVGAPSSLPFTPISLSALF